MSEEKPRRRIKLETRHGSSRESRSRKDRPCDVCRGRKSACVITVKPPCRFCEIRGLQCTFASNPRPRRRIDVSPPVEVTCDPRPLSANNQLDAESPQASRFPVPSIPLRRGSENSSLVSTPSAMTSSPVSTGRQYLSLQQLTSPTVPNSYSTPTSTTQISNHIKRPVNYHSLHRERSRHSLEYGKNLTAHFIGLGGEQDTNLFSSIRYNVLNETKFIDFNIRQVFIGDVVQGKPPIHFSILSDTFPERDQRVKRQASDAIENLVGQHSDALIRLYFRFVHPVLPVLSKSGFLATYATNKFSIAASLRGAIYGLACAFWSRDSSLSNYPCVSQPDIFDHTHAALNRELDSPKLATLQACLLVLHEQPDVNGTTESPRIWVVACQATACAQSLGLHQDPSSWKLPAWEIKLRKRLWWATYAGDTWTAICHGQTPHIVPKSFDTPFLEMDDLASDEDLAGLPGEQLVLEKDRTFNHRNAIGYIESIKLTKILAGVLNSAFTLQNYGEAIRNVDIMAREVRIQGYKAQLDEILSSLPEYLTVDYSPQLRTPNVNIFLHLGFFAVKFLILRAMMAPATSSSKSNPSSRLRYHFPAAMAEAENFMRFMMKIQTMDLHVFWFRHSRTNLIISGNFLIYLFFLASTESDVALVYNMLEKYRDILRELIKASDWSTIGLIRPSLLRTESFFHNAKGAIETAQSVGNGAV